MTRITLISSSGQRVLVDEGESANITATFEDLDAEILASTAILTLTATLINAADGVVINSREDQDVNNVGTATITALGVLTLRLQPLDNVIVSTTLCNEGVEPHYLTLTWTWNDGVATRTGKQEWEILVRKITPVA